MKRARFDERLDAVIEQALKRLYKRMKWAYFRGELREYLARIGLATVMEKELDAGNFQEIQEAAGNLLKMKIQRARKKGYLKDYLRKVNMMDILLGAHRIRTVTLRALPLPRVETAVREQSLTDGEDFIVRRFTLVK